MQYTSVQYLSQYLPWLIGIVIAGIVFRILYILIDSQINDYNPKEKIKRLIKALIMLITIPSTIAFIRRFYT